MPCCARGPVVLGSDKISGSSPLSSSSPHRTFNYTIIVSPFHYSRDSLCKFAIVPLSIPISQFIRIRDILKGGMLGMHELWKP